jgi:two-component system sensor histidine kinase VicK
MFNSSLFEEISLHANIVFFLYNHRENSLTYVTPNIENLLSMKFERFPEDYKPILEMIKKEDRSYVFDMLSQFQTEAFHDTVEFSMVLPDQTYKYVACTVSSLNNQDGKIEWIGGFVEDVTARKKFESSLYDYSSKKNSLLEILEHDLGAHLTLLKNIASLFTDKNVQTSVDKLSSYARSIQELSKASMDMISDLVRNEFIDSSNVPIRKTRVDVVARIKSILFIFKSSETLTGKNFIFHCDEEEIHAELDDVKFMQVINNLLYNALKFTKDGGKILVSISEKKETFILSVQDDGIGIPKEFHSIIFDKHTGAGRTGLKGEKTNGLGLSIAKSVVELHHGTIWFESTEGKGTSFYLELPKK